MNFLLSEEKINLDCLAIVSIDHQMLFVNLHFENDDVEQNQSSILILHE
jgi:hypothetical protein